MIGASAFVLACALHPAYCHSSAAAPFLAAVDAEIPDEQQRAVAVIFGHYESGLRPHPEPQSHDAKDGTSCGYLQQQCARVRGRTPRELVRMWIHDVQASPTGLAGLCGNGPAAARMAWRRASEAERLLGRIHQPASSARVAPDDVRPGVPRLRNERESVGTNPVRS